MVPGWEHELGDGPQDPQLLHPLKEQDAEGGVLLVGVWDAPTAQVEPTSVGKIKLAKRQHSHSMDQAALAPIS